jgi:hypothetical protein
MLQSGASSKSLVTLLLAASLCLPTGPVWAAIVNEPGCSQNALQRNDDEWASNVPLGFTLKLGDGFYDQTFVANNGYLTFGAAPMPWWSFELNSTWQTVIAAMIADIDTRPMDSDVVTYGQITYGGRRAFCVNYGAGNGVGHYDMMTDRLNRFQIILVERADTGLGDFDMIFNYDQVQFDALVKRTWIGWAPGQPYALPGSGQFPSLITDGEAHSLKAGSRNSPMPGRYIFNIRGGLPPATSVVSGTLLNPFGQPMANAPVHLCSTVDPTRCYFTTTNAQGAYALTILDAELDGQPFTLGTQTPAGEQWTAPAPSQVLPVPSQAVTVPAQAFQVPKPASSAQNITPSRVTLGGAPIVYWQAPLTLTYVAPCFGETGVEVSINEGMTGAGPLILSDWMTPVGTDPDSGTTIYEIAIPDGLYPNHGWVTFTYTVYCPGGAVRDEVNVYIDPSGNIYNVNGNRILGSLVTLYRSDSPLGPFEVVPDGSAIMSPTNRQNPMYSDTEGHFGWDTVPGFYVVRAAKPGCTDPAHPGRAYTETGVLPVPPPVTDLDLRLNCSAVPPPSISAPESFQAEATSAAGATVTYEASANDASDGPLPVRCTPKSGSLFPMGTTEVSCTTLSSYGHRTTVTFPVTVADTTPPVLSVPEPLSAFADSASGALVSFSASATDELDGATLQPMCTPASGSRFPPGTTSVQCTATDAQGNSAASSFPVKVIFNFGGVLPPLFQHAQASFRPHQAIPVRFELTGASSSISSLQARLFIAPVLNGSVGPEQPASAVGRGGNLFDALGPRALYQLMLDTRDLPPGTWRLRIDLGDGEQHTTFFSLTR